MRFWYVISGLTRNLWKVGEGGVQTLSQAQGDRLAVAAGCTFKWLSMDEALNIFGRYEEYHKTNIADFGLYRREYFALKEYKAHVR